MTHIRRKNKLENIEGSVDVPSGIIVAVFSTSGLIIGGIAEACGVPGATKAGLVSGLAVGAFLAVAIPVVTAITRRSFSQTVSEVPETVSSAGGGSADSVAIAARAPKE